MGEINKGPMQPASGEGIPVQENKIILAPEEIKRRTELIERTFPNLRFIDGHKRIFYMNEKGRTEMATLEEKAILQRERQKERPDRWNYFLLISVPVKKTLPWGNVQDKIINAGKRIKTYAPIKTISAKDKPEIMEKLVENYPTLSRVKLLPQAISPQIKG